MQIVEEHRSKCQINYLVLAHHLYDILIHINNRLEYNHSTIDILLTHVVVCLLGKSVITFMQVLLLSMIWLLCLVLNQLYFNASDPLSELWRRAWVIPAFWNVLSYVLLAIICALWTPSRNPTGYSICYEVHRLLIWVELFIWGLYVHDVVFSAWALSNQSLCNESWICLLRRHFILLTKLSITLLWKVSIYPRLICCYHQHLHDILKRWFNSVFYFNTYVVTNMCHACPTMQSVHF